jgi:ferric-dicitrate binding protein FerR (iron transport regulator)
LHRNTSLVEAEQILLEEHLETCAGCRRTREQLLLAREIAHHMPLDPMGATAHQRALARALLSRNAEQPQQRSWRFAPIAAAAALAGVIALWLATREQAMTKPALSPIAHAVHDAAIEPVTAQVVAGELRAGTAALAPGAVVPERTSVQAIVETRVALPIGTFTVAADSAIQWASAEQAVTLERGSVEVEVDPKAATRLRVATPGFIVEVTGTVFTVTVQSVSVVRGSVRIVAHDGSVLVPQLAAGETWSLEPARPQVISARVWIERAVRAFAAGDCKSAEHHADAALDAGPTRPQAAEARTLVAECRQASGRLGEALRLYDVIASRFADLPAGETAAIAAARIEVARGRAGDARKRFERYLERYPAGRYADDARRQREALAP